MDRFRLDDPDAAEKAARIFYDNVGHVPTWLPDYLKAIRQAIRAVLDAIEQPRLPTRSEVASWFGDDWSTYRPATIAAVLIKHDLATEDPEPEVDPPVDELDVSFLRDLLAKLDGRAAQNQALGYSDYARWLLQSGAITVRRERRRAR